MHNTKTRNKIKLSNMLKISVITVLIAMVLKMLMSRYMGRFDWCYSLITYENRTLLENVIYYGTLVVSLVLYYLSVSKMRWKHAVRIGLIPACLFILAFYPVCEDIYPIWIAALISFIGLDVWGLSEYLMIKREGYKTLFFKKVCGKIVENATIMILVAGIVSVMVLCYTGKKYEEAYVAAADELEGEILASAPNMRDLNSNTSENLWESNKESLKKLSEEIYFTLSFDERVIVLQEFLNIQSEVFGLEPIQLVVMSLKEKGLGGFYWDEARTIAIEITYVESENSLNSIYCILHEAVHAYQHECVREYEKIRENDEINDKLLVFRDFEKWEKEFNDYCSVEEATALGDISLYENQAIEQAADAYAEEWLLPYWNFINSIED